MRTLSAALLLIVALPLCPLAAQDDLFQNNQSRVDEFQSSSNARLQQAGTTQSGESGPVSSYSSSGNGTHVYSYAIQGTLIVLSVICLGMWMLLSRRPTKEPPPPIKL